MSILCREGAIVIGLVQAFFVHYKAARTAAKSGGG